MFGGPFRVLFGLLLALLAGLIVLSLVAYVVAGLMPLLFLLAPALIVYWIATHHAAPQSRIPRGRPFGRARAWRRYHDFARFERAEPTTSPVSETGSWVRQARSLADDIGRLVKKSDRATREALADIPRSARKLADRVADLARSSGALDQHLRESTPHEYRRRAAELEHRAATATDPLAREQYQAAAQSLEEQATLCEELARTRERLHAEIERIVAALSNLRARIVALQSGISPMGSDAERASEGLAELESQVETFQESIRQVLRQAAR